MTKYKISFILEGTDIDHDTYNGMSKRTIEKIIKNNFNIYGAFVDRDCDTKVSKLNIERV